MSRRSAGTAKVDAARQPANRGRVEPLAPIPSDLDEIDAPPRRGKVHPRDEMDAVTPTLDDEHRRYPHHPSDSGVTEFGFDPDAADAAADMAGDLGSAFLEGATRGEDMSDVTMTAADRAEDDELPLLLDEEGDEPVEEEGPRAVRTRPFEAPGALGQQSAREARPAEQGPSPRRRPRR